MRLLDYSNRLLDRGTEFAYIDRTVSILFNQMERDFFCMYVPYKWTKKKTVIKKGDKKETEIKTDMSGIERKLINSFFETEVEDALGTGENKRQPFKSVNFITTAPLQIYNERKVNAVRVKYQLKANKDKYDLFRYETNDLENVKFSESGFSESKFNESRFKKGKKIQKYKVATNIKELVIQYGKYVKKKGETEETLKYVYDWSYGVELPTVIKIKLVLSNADMSKEFTSTTVIPILAKDSLAQASLIQTSLIQTSLEKTSLAKEKTEDDTKKK